jgi:hypothetical protein
MLICITTLLKLGVVADDLAPGLQDVIEAVRRVRQSTQ